MSPERNITQENPSCAHIHHTAVIFQPGKSSAPSDRSEGAPDINHFATLLFWTPPGLQAHHLGCRLALVCLVTLVVATPLCCWPMFSLSVIGSPLWLAPTLSMPAFLGVPPACCCCCCCSMRRSVLQAQEALGLILLNPDATFSTSPP